jgi:hypothetical protein
MNADLERLIALQRLDSAARDAQRRLAEEPEREKALEARLDAARQLVAATKKQLASNQAARRESEKEVAVHQGRLSKFRDQLMAVKTNHEYQAMQKEMGFSQAEIKAMEDKILERMLDGDDLSAAAARAEATLAAEQRAVDADRRAMAAELTDLHAALEQITTERAQIVTALTSEAIAIFELVANRRNGVALAEARDGICTICHVRLRPQVFNTIRLNEDIVQCDTCNRILYFVPPAASAAAASSDDVGQPAQ